MLTIEEAFKIQPHRQFVPPCSREVGAVGRVRRICAFGEYNAAESGKIYAMLTNSRKVV